MFIFVRSAPDRAFLTVRVLLVGLLSTGLFTPGFLIGLGGTLLSLLLMEAGRRSQLFSPYGIGILGLPHIIQVRS